jgi:hypothetical protein
MLVVFVSTLVFLALGESVHRHAGVPIAVVSGVWALLAAGLWLLSLRLHNRLMERRAAQEANPASAGAHGTATQVGLKWVTQLTNLAVGMVLAAAIPLVEAIAP